MADRSGADFFAVVEITKKDGSVVAAVGERCDRVDPNALGWLEQCGAISPADAVTSEGEDGDGR